MNSTARAVTAAVALATVTGAYVLSQGRVEQPVARLSRPPVSASRPVPLPLPPPDARTLLVRAEALGLRAEQRADLEALDRRWTQERRDLEAALQEEQESFADLMAKAQTGQGATIQQVQRESEAFSRASAELRRRRLQHWEAAVGMLTDPQRARLAVSSATTTKGEER